MTVTQILLEGGISMTSNQLSYLNLQETKRNNLVVSKETKRHNKRNERLTRRANLELARHNKQTEANQLVETQAGITRSQIAADASKYGADRSSAATRYAADKSASASRYATDRNAQTQWVVAKINQQVQAAHDAMNKTINDDNINNKTQTTMLKNQSDQFIAKLNRDLEKYGIDTNKSIKLKQLETELIKAASNKDNDTKTIIIGKILSDISDVIAELISSSKGVSK
nr:putative ORF1 [Marmot picobirnavirus]